MLVARPPAKVNLTLSVGKRREDGYHELRSVFLRIGLADRLTVSAAAANERDELAVTGLPGCPVEGNLVLRALEVLRRDRAEGPPLRASLEKQIPMGAGLGGGSSDGASALDLATQAWGIDLPSAQLDGLAIGLGSDVPFFAANVPVALVEGRGERVSQLPAVVGGAGILLAISTLSLSTGSVFARFDEIGRHSAGEATDLLAEALRGGLEGAALADMAGSLSDANALWPAASSLAPELVERRAWLEQCSNRLWMMSGSGPTLFAIFPSVAEAIAGGEELAQQPTDAMRGVMLCATDLESPDPAWRQEWPTDH